MKPTAWKFFCIASISLAAFAAVPASRAQTTNAPVPKLSQEELETKFKAMLTNATLAGRWCMLTNGELGPDREDKYTIQGITKAGGDAWIIYAHIQYAQRDVIAPVPVTVKWSGDTPVLIVDNLGIPGGGTGGTYTARVMFYENTYSGTWSGGARRGMLHGTISHPPEKKD